MPGVSVRKVEDDQNFKSGDMKVFFEFPWTIYKNDPNWVPPLLSARTKMLSKSKNPSWEYLQGNYYVAWRGTNPVGIIAAFVNKRHNEQWKENIGWFGFFECFDDQEAATALLTAASEDVKARGVTAICGPANFTLNDECGLLIENFSQPVLLMPYNPPYYQRLIENSGLNFAKVMDLESWYSNPKLLGGEDGKGLPKKLMNVVEKTKEKRGITIRKPSLKTLKDDLKLLREIFVTAWARNWGAVPPTDHELDHLFVDLKDYYEPSLVRFAEVNGEIASFVLGLPDMNQVLIKAYARPGEPELITMIKAAWYWKIKPLITRKETITGQRILLFGVKPKYQALGVDAAINLDLFQGLLDHPKYWDTDCGWFLEVNQPMLQLAKTMNAQPYKRYRIYQTALGQRISVTLRIPTKIRR